MVQRARLLSCRSRVRFLLSDFHFIRYRYTTDPEFGHLNTPAAGHHLPDLSLVLLPNARTSGLAPVTQMVDPAGAASTGDGHLRFTNSLVDNSTAGRDNLPPGFALTAVGEQYLPCAPLPPVPSLPTVPLDEEVAALVAGLIDGNLVSLEASTPANDGFAGWPYDRV